VVCLHYIVDKPWIKRVGKDGIAGYRGCDGETHQWWWNEYGQWERERKGAEVVELVRRLVAKQDGGARRNGKMHEWEGNEDMRAIGSHVQSS